MTEYTFPKALRLRTSAEFKRVYDLRTRASDPRLLIFAGANDLPHARLGLSVSRKVGPAHVRARWKRLLREAFRLNQHRLPAGLDVIVIPRPGVEPCLEELAESLLSIAGRLHRRIAREVR